VAEYVRERPHDTARWAQRGQPVRALLALGAVADALMTGADVDAMAEQVAAGAGLKPAVLAQTLRQHAERLQGSSDSD
jgi:hypothetical protein